MAHLLCSVGVVWYLFKFEGDDSFFSLSLIAVRPDPGVVRTVTAFIFAGWAITNAVQNVPVLVNMLAEALPANNSLGFKPAHVTVLRFLMSSLDLTAEFKNPRLSPWFINSTIVSVGEAC